MGTSAVYLCYGGSGGSKKGLKPKLGEGGGPGGYGWCVFTCP